MCMSMAAAAFRGTQLYAGEAMRNGKYVHVLAYANRAESYAGPNAMIFPLPAVELGPENVIDTRKFKDFVKDIKVATETRRLSRGLSFDGSKGAGAAAAGAVQVFNVGSYTVVVAKHIVGLAKALAGLPEDKRPKVNREVLAQIRDLYPDQPIVAACWSGEIEAEPLLFWYEPMFPGVLYAPALDSHDGRGPKKGPVDVDHHIAFGSTINPRGPRQVEYSSKIPEETLELLPQWAVGKSQAGKSMNGDFYMNVHEFTAAPELGMTMFRAWPSTLDQRSESQIVF